MNEGVTTDTAPCLLCFPASSLYAQQANNFELRISNYSFTQAWLFFSKLTEGSEQKDYINSRGLCAMVWRWIKETASDSRWKNDYLDFTATCEIHVVIAGRPAGHLCQSVLESRCLQMTHTHTLTEKHTSLVYVLRITSPLTVTVTHERIFFLWLWMLP